MFDLADAGGCVEADGVEGLGVGLAFQREGTGANGIFNSVAPSLALLRGVSHQGQIPGLLDHGEASSVYA